MGRSVMSDNRDHNSSRRRFLTGAATVGAATVAGCSGSSNQAGEGTNPDGSGGNDTSSTAGTPSEANPTLEIWLGVYTESGEKRRYIDSVVKQFEEQTGTKIQIRGIPYSDFTTKLQAAAAAGDLPHLAEISANTGSLRFAQPINSLLKGSKTEQKATDSLIQAHKRWGAQITGSVGTILTWPLGLRPHIPTWRKDWLEAANIDPSAVEAGAGSLHWYDDLKPMYEKMQQSSMGQKKGHHPSHTSMKQSDEEFLSIYLGQFGAGLAGVVNKTGTESILDTKEAYEAIRHQFRFLDKKYYHPESITWGDEESTTAQWSGLVAEIHNQDTADLWTAYLAEKPQMMRNLRFTWGLPFKEKNTATLVKTPSVAFMDGAFKGQAEKDAAVEFLDYWAAKQQNAVGNARTLGFVPIAPSIIRSAEFFGKTKLHTKFWREAVASTLEESKYANISAVPSKSINYAIPAKMHQRIHAKGWSVERAADQAAQEINSILKEKGNR